MRERFVLRPDNNSLAALTQSFPGGYYASCYLLTDCLTDDCPGWSKIAGLNTTAVWCAASRLIAGGWSIKIVARDSIALREACQRLRKALAEWIPSLQSDPRKM